MTDRVHAAADVAEQVVRPPTPTTAAHGTTSARGGPHHRVAAVVPALNEATAIGELTAGLLGAGACCVVVVDGGSIDGTAEIARTAGGIVIDEPRRGYGRACLTGAAYASLDHPIIAFLDGDGSCDPGDLGPLVAALDDADLAIGDRSRAANERGSLPWHARLGNRLVAWLLSHRTGRTVSDLPPFKVIRRSALASLDLDDGGFGWTVQLIARSLRTPGLRIAQRPARFRRRRGGTSKVSGSLRASVAAGRGMIMRAMSETTRRPMIALMAKAPRAGHAKTRLAAGIGEDAALAFWAACLADLGPAIRETVRGVADTVAVVPSLDDVEPVSALLGPGWSVVVQRRTGLGGAIVDAFAEAETRGADRAIAISGDNPTLPTHWLLTGLDTLRRHGAVLGPCPDGGYYLVGMRLRRRRPWVSRRPPVADRADRVFRTARLGGENARSTTARALDSEGFRAHVMEMWPDIDTAADLAYLAASLRGEQPRAPWTRQWLAAYAALVPVTGEGRAIEAAESPLAGNMRGSHPAERGPTT